MDGAAHHRSLRSKWRRGDLARAGWTVRTVRRAAGDAARDRARTSRPSRRRCTRVAAARRRFLGLGHSPTWTLAETPVMPKQRYDIMAKLHAQGRRARPRHDVPHLYRAGESRFRHRSRHGARSCGSPWRCSPSSPRSSPIRRSPRASRTASCRMRSEIWRDTDNQRSGMIPFAFEPGMGFERYTDWALDVPMYFVKRGDVYHDVAGASFRDLLAGRCRSCLASAPPCRTGRTTCRRCFPRCG